MTVTNCGIFNGEHAYADFFHLTHVRDKMTVSTSSDGDICVLTGNVVQHGSHFTASGTYHCEDGEKGAWSSPDIHLTEHALVM